MKWYIKETTNNAYLVNLTGSFSWESRKSRATVFCSRQSAAERLKEVKAYFSDNYTRSFGYKFILVYVRDKPSEEATEIADWLVGQANKKRAVRSIVRADLTEGEIEARALESCGVLIRAGMYK